MDNSQFVRIWFTGIFSFGLQSWVVGLARKQNKKERNAKQRLASPAVRPLLANNYFQCTKFRIPNNSSKNGTDVPFRQRRFFQTASHTAIYSSCFRTLRFREKNRGFWFVCTIRRAFANYRTRCDAIFLVFVVIINASVFDRTWNLNNWRLYRVIL